MQLEFENYIQTAKQSYNETAQSTPEFFTTNKQTSSLLSIIELLSQRIHWVWHLMTGYAFQKFESSS